MSIEFKVKAIVKKTILKSGIHREGGRDWILNYTSIQTQSLKITLSYGPKTLGTLIEFDCLVPYFLINNCNTQMSNFAH